MSLEAKNISFKYNPKGEYILHKVNLTIEEGERVGIIGPSGYGKSTLAKILSGYEIPQIGEVLFNGKPLLQKGVCPVQLIYQHPEKAINPRWKMSKVFEESGDYKEEVLYKLGIEKEWLSRYPRELSGGELQRLCVARAMTSSTRFLIADEMSTMLDAITAAALWNYIIEESVTRNMGMIVITHNKELAKRVCTRVIDLKDINGI